VTLHPLWGGALTSAAPRRQATPYQKVADDGMNVALALGPSFGAAAMRGKDLAGCAVRPPAPPPPAAPPLAQRLRGELKCAREARGERREARPRCAA
jgi:hypothetical protein